MVVGWPECEGGLDNRQYSDSFVNCALEAYMHLTLTVYYFGRLSNEL